MGPTAIVKVHIVCDEVRKVIIESHVTVQSGPQNQAASLNSELCRDNLEP